MFFEIKINGIDIIPLVNKLRSVFHNQKNLGDPKSVFFKTV